MTISFTHLYNVNLVAKAHRLGGVWSGEAWVFPDLVADKIAEMETLYNGEMVAVEITAKSNLSCSRGPVTFLGYPIASAFSRDGGAKLGTGVSLIDGDITSGGSRANWTSNVDKGSVFRLKVPKNCSKN